MPEPLYTADNSRAAYQLHWSLTAFAEQAIPDEQSWREALQIAIEPDGARLLELHRIDSTTLQFFLSSRPDISPSQIVRSVKGRLQYLLRDQIPKFWRRHYAITSVGDANNEVLDGYMGRQTEHHPMADPRVADILAQSQFHDPQVDLAELRASGHGQFTHSLHLVLKNASHLLDTRPEHLAATQRTAIAMCAKKGWLLSRLALAANHLHALLGCGVTDSPQAVALSWLNNLAYASGMRPIYAYTHYVGAFGAYDHAAIRRKLRE